MEEKNDIKNPALQVGKSPNVEKRIRITVKYSLIPVPDEIYFYPADIDKAYNLWMEKIAQKNVRWIDVEIIEIKSVEDIEKQFLEKVGLTEIEHTHKIGQKVS